MVKNEPAKLAKTAMRKTMPNRIAQNRHKDFLS